MIVNYNELPHAEEVLKDLNAFRYWMDMTKADIRSDWLIIDECTVPKDSILLYEPTDEECPKLCEYAVLQAIQVKCDLCPEDCKKEINYRDEILDWIDEDMVRRALGDLMGMDLALHQQVGD